MSSEETIRVAEIFGPTIQGEGVLIGLPTVFVRSGGCDYRCVWCDSPHAVHSRFREQWLPLSTEQVWEKVQALSGGQPLMVSLSGGNPAIQPFGSLIRRGHDAGYRFALETQGSVARDWFDELDVLILSPKPPSSGMTTDWDILEECLQAADDKPEIVLKIVIFDDEDYAYARKVAERLPGLPVYLQPGNPSPPTADGQEPLIDMDQMTERMRQLVDRVTQDRWFEARVLPQLHVILWGNKRGV